MNRRACQATVLAALLVGSPAGSAASATIGPNGTRVSVPVRSMQDLRFTNLVRQSWDVSCGAAALSTLLTYHLDRPVTEYAVATWILRGVDPQRVRARGGFSLFDLKRFAQALGYRAEGFGNMTLDELVALSVPAITPVRIHGLDHFVIVRGVIGGHVVIGDPAFGNLTMPARRFARIWKGGIAFVVQRDRDDTPLALDATAQIADLRIPDLPAVSRLLRGAGPAPITRGRPALP